MTDPAVTKTHLCINCKLLCDSTVKSGNFVPLLRITPVVHLRVMTWGGILGEKNRKWTIMNSPK